MTSFHRIGTITLYDTFFCVEQSKGSFDIIIQASQNFSHSCFLMSNIFEIIHNLFTTHLVPSMADELFLGQHFIIELSDCCVESLNDPKKIQACFLECAEMVNATVICTNFHHFEPYGVSGVVVISESHMTIHTWPEFKYAAVDVFTCSSKMESYKCLDFLAAKFHSKNFSSKYIPRGFIKHLTVDAKQMEKYRDYFLNFRERGTWGEKKQI